MAASVDRPDGVVDLKDLFGSGSTTPPAASRRLRAIFFMPQSAPPVQEGRWGWGRGRGFPTLQDGSIPAALLVVASTNGNFDYKAITKRMNYRRSFLRGAICGCFALFRNEGRPGQWDKIPQAA
jgi:hypothetical protein